MATGALSVGPTMTPQRFVEKWRPVTLSERSAAQTHFQDLCRLFEHPDPVEADPEGTWFTFEKGLSKSGGGDGFADVWKRAHFAWEYKKRKRNLDEALGQLARYALALESPPLHIVCDTERFRIVTAWQNAVPRSYDLGLDDLLDPAKRAWLEAAFYQPDRLRPGETRAELTKAAADKFSMLASRLRSRGHSPNDVAHFVNRLVFLFFAEDVRLIPDGYFRRILKEVKERPAEAKELLSCLFDVLSKGGRFGIDRLPHVNGGLFDDKPALDLADDELRLIIAAGSQNWAHIDPSIFGTLFERFLDPDKRAQIGAHYTDSAKILQIVEPVIVRPLRAEWQASLDVITTLIGKARSKGPKAKEWKLAEEERSAFLERLRCVSVLDPACGSGNFLYLALRAIKDLEHSANQQCEALGLAPRWPMVGPEILHGIEINPLAAELARTTAWIGDIQWGIQNGFYTRPEPILRPIKTIECRDALIAVDADNMVTEAEWPDAEFIVGNPPFLGGKIMRNGRPARNGKPAEPGLGDEYVDRLFRIYKDRVPAEADLVTYWFDKARAEIAAGRARRAGFVSTNSIRGGANRRVLERVTDVAPLFEAWSDEEWVVDGADVRVSLVCFGRNEGKALTLNGIAAPAINTDLTAATADLTRARRLVENRDVAFMGDTKGGAFDIPGTLARQWLSAPPNANGRPNSDVIKRWANGAEIANRSPDKWIVDFGWNMDHAVTQFYEQPYEHIVRIVKPSRALNAREAYASKWWQHVEPRQGMWRALSRTDRYIATIRHSKHRTFAWFDKRIVPDSALIVIARDDDSTFGVLHSHFHEAWTLRLCTWLGVGNDPRYTPTTTFETFPFPEGLTPDIPASAYADDPRAVRIAAAARELDEHRRKWLNPPSLVAVVPEVYPTPAMLAAGHPSLYPDRILPKDEQAASDLRTRTLTRLYNERPAWLDNLHEALNRAVAAAYGWPEDIETDDALARLLALNAERAANTLSTGAIRDA